MSLSFVSKSIQTQDEGGDFRETAVAGADDNESATKEHHRPLFDQLRTNKEREDEEREEFQRGIMRGTLALDEGDAAYLHELHQEKTRREALKQQETELELAAFHAAKMEQEETRNLPTKETKQEKSSISGTISKRPIPASAIAPALFKKRRKVHTNDSIEQSTKPARPTESSTNIQLEAAGLCGLLAGYSSDSDA